MKQSYFNLEKASLIVDDKKHSYVINSMMEHIDLDDEHSEYAGMNMLLQMIYKKQETMFKIIFAVCRRRVHTNRSRKCGFSGF